MNLPELPVTYYPSKIKNLLITAVCALLAVGGIIMGTSGEQIGYLIAALFGIGAIVILLNLLPSSAYLTLTVEGIEFKNLFRSHQIAWRDIREFGAYKLRMNKMVGFNYADSYSGQEKGRAVAKAMSGYEGALPDTYGHKAEDLATLLSAYHQRWQSK